MCARCVCICSPVRGVSSLVHTNQCQFKEAQGSLMESQGDLRSESLARQQAEEALRQSKGRTWQDQSFHYLTVSPDCLMPSYVFTHTHTYTHTHTLTHIHSHTYTHTHTLTHIHSHTYTHTHTPSDLEQWLDTQTNKLQITVHELQR